MLKHIQVVLVINTEREPTNVAAEVMRAVEDKDIHVITATGVKL